MAPHEHPTVRLLILFYRKNGMSFEDFDRYWRETHAEVALSLPIFRHNLLKYEQIHVDRSIAHSWTDKGYQVSDYDGIVVLEAESAEKIEEIFHDEEYLQKLAPDEEKFTEKKTFNMMITRTVTVMDNTK